jgi:hypothetical protein
MSESHPNQSPLGEEVDCVIAVWPYVPQDDTELGFAKGDKIVIIHRHNQDWYEGKVRLFSTPLFIQVKHILSMSLGTCNLPNSHYIVTLNRHY